MTFWARLKSAITKPSMTRVVLIGLLLSAALFIASVELYRELATIPLAWLISFGMCGILYTIDRWGFASIDTVEMLWESPELYKWWVMIYAGLIITAHMAAYIIMGA